MGRRANSGVGRRVHELSTHDSQLALNRPANCDGFVCSYLSGRASQADELTLKAAGRPACCKAPDVPRWAGRIIGGCSGLRAGRFAGYCGFGSRPAARYTQARQGSAVADRLSPPRDGSGARLGAPLQSPDGTQLFSPSTP